MNEEDTSEMEEEKTWGKEEEQIWEWRKNKLLSTSLTTSTPLSPCPSLAFLPNQPQFLSRSQPLSLSLSLLLSLLSLHQPLFLSLSPAYVEV